MTSRTRNHFSPIRVLHPGQVSPRVIWADIPCFSMKAAIFRTRPKYHCPPPMPVHPLSVEAGTFAKDGLEASPPNSLRCYSCLRTGDGGIHQTFSILASCTSCCRHFCTSSAPDFSWFLPMHELFSWQPASTTKIPPSESPHQWALWYCPSIL